MKKVLVIMAAGMGSRFGGLKQIEPVGPSNEFIIDYSIYDAIKAGFTSVVFIIKEENLEVFKETVGNRISKYIKTEYVFQDMENVPDKYKTVKREKPWGTSHAIMSLKGVVKDDFAVINADDFYGRDAFIKASNYLDSHEEGKYANIVYDVLNTLSENGSVKRGVCKEENGYLTNLIESKIELVNKKIIAKPLESDEEFVVPNDSPVSMNFFVFKNEIIDYLCDHFEDFLDNAKDILTSEYLLPESVFTRVKNNEIKVKLIKTTAKWFGVTYREDKELVVKGINALINDNVYPKNLWNK